MDYTLAGLLSVLSALIILAVKLSRPRLYRCDRCGFKTYDAYAFGYHSCEVRDGGEK